MFISLDTLLVAEDKNQGHTDLNTDATLITNIPMKHFIRRADTLNYSKFYRPLSCICCVLIGQPFSTTVQEVFMSVALNTFTPKGSSFAARPCSVIFLSPLS